MKTNTAFTRGPFQLSRQDQEFRSFGLMLRDKNENLFLQSHVSRQERDFFYQSRTLRREREFLLSLLCFETRMKISVFSLMQLGAGEKQPGGGLGHLGGGILQQ